MVTPWLVWQAGHGWPQLAVSRSIATGGSTSSPPWWQIVPFQVLLVGPLLAPELLAGPDQRDDWAISAETAVPGGDQLEPALGAAPFATLLHRLIQTAPRVGEVPSLSPSPPWAAWEHEDGASWAARDDTGRDLNRLPGPAWVDHAGGAVRHALACYNAPRRIGHGDWESQNIRWNGQAVLVVHDWDSVIAQPEAAITRAASSGATR